MDRIFISPASPRSLVLPILTASLGTTGLLSGAGMFYSPFDMARQFGIVVDTSSKTSPPNGQEALINAVGIRNIASGASLLALTAYWQFSPLARASPVAAVATKRVLGLSLLIGAVVALGDSFLLTRLANGGDHSDEARTVAGEGSKGHAFVSVPMLGLALGCLFT